MDARSPIIFTYQDNPRETIMVDHGSHSASTFAWDGRFGCSSASPSCMTEMCLSSRPSRPIPPLEPAVPPCPSGGGRGKIMVQEADRRAVTQNHKKHFSDPSQAGKTRVPRGPHAYAKPPGEENEDQPGGSGPMDSALMNMPSGAVNIASSLSLSVTGSASSRTAGLGSLSVLSPG